MQHRVESSVLLVVGQIDHGPIDVGVLFASLIILV
jgi:hypothetical protein